MTDTVMTIEEAAERLNLHPHTTYRLCRRGVIPGAVRLGRTWRIDRETLESYMRAGRSGNTAPVRESATA